MPPPQSASVDPPVFAVPECSREVLAALVLSPHLPIRQRRSDVAGGAGQSHIQEAGPGFQEARRGRALMASALENSISNMETAVGKRKIHLIERTFPKWSRRQVAGLMEDQLLSSQTGFGFNLW